MALKPCKECGREISTEAKTCPNCGERNPTAAPVNAWVVLGIIVLVILMIGGGLSSSDSSGPARPPTPAQLAAQHVADSVQAIQKVRQLQLYNAVELCHQAAERRLKAPATARRTTMRQPKKISGTESHTSS